MALWTLLIMYDINEQWSFMIIDHVDHVWNLLIMLWYAIDHAWNLLIMLWKAVDHAWNLLIMLWKAIDHAWYLLIIAVKGLLIINDVLHNQVIMKVIVTTTVTLTMCVQSKLTSFLYFSFRQKTRSLKEISDKEGDGCPIFFFSGQKKWCAGYTPVGSGKYRGILWAKKKVTGFCERRKKGDRGKGESKQLQHQSIWRQTKC